MSNITFSLFLGVVSPPLLIRFRHLGALVGFQSNLPTPLTHPTTAKFVRVSPRDRYQDLPGRTKSVTVPRFYGQSIHLPAQAASVPHAGKCRFYLELPRCPPVPRTCPRESPSRCEFTIIRPATVVTTSATPDSRTSRTASTSACLHAGGIDLEAEID